MNHDTYQWEGPRLRAYRAHLGLSPKQMADALDMKDRAYTSMESGRAAVPAGVLDDILVLVDRWEALISDMAAQQVINIAGMGGLQLRAVGAALARNPGLRVTDEQPNL